MQPNGSRTLKHIPPVARPAGHGGTGMRTAGAASRENVEFGAEFDALVEEARRLHEGFRRAMNAHAPRGAPKTNAA